MVSCVKLRPVIFFPQSIQVGFDTAEADVGAPGGVRRRGISVAARADIPRGGARRGPDSRPAHVPAVHGAGESGIKGDDHIFISDSFYYVTK